jgi:hypothetical protein
VTAIATMPEVTALPSPLERFVKANAIVDRFWERRRPRRTALQAAYEADVIARWRRAHPESKRKRITYKALWNREREWCKTIMAEWQPRATAMSKRHSAQLDRLNAILTQLADRITLTPSETVWSCFRTIDDGSYHTQGWGAAKYAKGEAEMKADIAGDYDVPVQIVRFSEPMNGYPPRTGWKVWVALGPIECAVLDYKPGKKITAKEWMDRCWKRGVNPYVYNPFLAHC